MAKFYCSTCGVELEHKRRAVPGKGIILDLITPHECEGYSIKSNEFENPTVEDIINSAKPLGQTKLVSEKDQTQSTFEAGDMRGDKRSIAPRSLIDAMSKHQIAPGEPEG
jgi:hypothetical protein